MKSISYLGPEGSYCEQATIDIYRNEKLFPIHTIPAVIESVQDGITDYGVVPIENSIEGSVTVTLDALIHDYDVNINSESCNQETCDKWGKFFLLFFGNVS